MSNYNLELNSEDVVLLSAMLDEEIRRTFDNLYARHLIKKDGQPNKIKKYLSEYEEGLLEDYYRLRNLNSEVERYMLEIV